MTRPVLMVLHDFLPEVVAGTELHVLRLAKALADRRPVHVLHTVRDPSSAQGACERRMLEGLPITRIVQNYPWQSLSEQVQDRALETRFLAVVESLGTPLVHFHHLARWPLSLPELARRRGLPTLFTLHDYALVCPSGGQLIHHPDGTLCEQLEPPRCTTCYARRQVQAGGLEALALRMSGLPGLPVGWPFRLYHRLPLRLKAGVRRLNEAVERGMAPSRSPGARVAPGQAAARLQASSALMNTVNRFIAPSSDLARRFMEWGLPGERLLMLPHPGPEWRSCLPLPPRHPLRLAFVGTLAPHKGLDLVVSAVLSLPPGSIVLTVCGNPDGFPAYTRPLLARSGPHIRFVGPCTQAQVQAVLEHSHALVMASRWPENAPLTVLEAFAAGRCVVAPQAGGIPELVQDGRNGLLFAPDSLPALRNALSRLLEIPMLLEQLTAGVVPPPTLAEYLERLEALYDEVVDG